MKSFSKNSSTLSAGSATAMKLLITPEESFYSSSELWSIILQNVIHILICLLDVWKEDPSFIAPSLLNDVKQIR